MRLYRKTKPQSFPVKPAQTSPGFTLSQIIDQFYAEGVVPDFIPADLGEDLVSEVDVDGRWLVDPDGDIRTDRLEKMENDLMAGLDAVVDPAPDSATVSNPTTVPDIAPVSEASPAPEE